MRLVNISDGATPLRDRGNWPMRSPTSHHFRSSPHLELIPRIEGRLPQRLLLQVSWRHIAALIHTKQILLHLPLTFARYSGAPLLRVASRISGMPMSAMAYCVRSAFCAVVGSLPTDVVPRALSDV